MAITHVDIPKLILSGNENYLKLYTTSALSTYTKHSLIITISINDEEYEAILPATTDGAYRSAIFDLSFALRQTNQFVFPVPSILNELFIDVGTIKYSISAYERYYNTSTGAWVTSSSVDIIEDYYAFDGGLSDREQNRLQLRSSNFFREYVEGMKFLTNVPDGGTISPNCPVCLFFANKDNVGLQRSILFNITSQNANGNEATESYSINFTADDYTMNQVMFAPNILDSDADIISGNTITKIRVSFLIGSTTSEARTYYVEQSDIVDKKYILYKNSFGAYDCLEVLGQEEVIGDSDKNVVAARQQDASVGVVYLKQLESKFNMQTNTDVGYLPASDIKYLIDLLNSSDIYLINDWILAYEPEKIIITTNESVLKNNVQLDQLYNFPLSYHPASTNKYYTRQISPLIHLDPPEYRNLDALFRTFNFDEIDDVLNSSRHISISEDATYGTMITFPSSLQQFRFDNTTYWDISVQALPWYDGPIASICPLSFLTEANFTTYATTLTINSVFLNTYESGFEPKDLLPIVVYNGSKTASRFWVGIMWYLVQMSSL